MAQGGKTDRAKKTKEVTKTAEKNRKERKRKKGVRAFLKSKLFGIILSGVQLVITVILLAMLLYLNILPLKYFLPLTLLLLLLVGYTFLTAQSKKFRTFGKILSVVICLLWSIGIYYVGYANGMFNGISGANTKTDIINVYVLKDNDAQSINEAKDYTFGILSSLDRENTDKMVTEINSIVGKSIALQEFDSWPDMVQSLYDKTIDAIILKEAYVSSIIETEEYAGFENDTRILHQKTIVVELDVDTDKDVTNDTFTLYISGIDVAGSITTTSRSDVNIIAVVNPKTKQVLLLNTPRDYFIPLAMEGGPMDKLTHAGIYGVDMSMNTLSNLYGIKLDYYFRINFTGFERVVNELGGIEINSDYAFTTTHGGYYIKKGANYLNGAQTLGYVRERYAFGTGDNQRGKNQMAVITAIINKMSASTLLSNFEGLSQSLQSSVQTSMAPSQLSDLVRMQLNEGGSWNVKSYAVTGTSDDRPTYSLSISSYVMIPDYTTVNKAKELIQKVYDGKILTDDDVK